MTEVNENAVEEIRTPVTVLGGLKTKIGKLARQEAKAVESDSLAATFNDTIVKMATGEEKQTSQRNIHTVSSDQVKHVKRAEKIRTNNKELADEIRAELAEFNGMAEDLLAPYASEEADAEAEDFADEEAEAEAEAGE